MIFTGNDHLRVKLVASRNDPGYLPGEDLHGVVTRWEPLVDAMVKIKVTMFAKVRTKVTNRLPPKIGNTYHSEVNLFGAVGRQMVVYHRPVAITNTTQQPTRWEFSFQIPYTMRRVDVIKGDAQAWSFLGSDKAEVCLPASNHVSHHSLSKFGEGDVEYYLQAELSDSLGNVATATTSVNIATRTTALTLNKIRPGVRFQRDAVIASYQLLTSEENPKVPVKERIAGMLGSSCVPKSSYSLQICIPSVIQLENPLGVSFTVAAQANERKTTPGLPQRDLVVQEFNVYIQQIAKMAARKGSREYMCRDKKEFCVLRFKRGRKCGTSNKIGTSLKARFGSKGKKPLTLPLDSPDQPVNIGRLLGMIVEERPKLKESYAAPNILVYHQIRWELTLSLAGEERVFEGISVVLLRGPPGPPGLR